MYFFVLLEWVEFSPFEYGIAKYGVFGKTNEFGGKYFKGQLIKKFEESPLHYLQGIVRRQFIDSTNVQEAWVALSKITAN